MRERVDMIISEMTLKYCNSKVIEEDDVVVYSVKKGYMIKVDEDGSIVYDITLNSIDGGVGVGYENDEIEDVYESINDEIDVTVYEKVEQYTT